MPIILQFTIQANSKNLIKQVLKEMNLDEKRFPLPAIISNISNAKNALLLPDAYAREPPATMSSRWQKFMMLIRKSCRPTMP